MSDISEAKQESAKDRVAKPLKEIPETTLTSAEVEDRLIKARIEMLMSAPFFGNLATRLVLEDATDWCATAATDGRKFFYNENFINTLNPKQTEFLFGHEILHCVYDHFTRRDSRDPQIFNIAADYCVNGDLVRHNIGEMITQVKPFHDPKYYGWATEAVYDDIYKKYDDESDFNARADDMAGGPSYFQGSIKQLAEQFLQNDEASEGDDEDVKPIIDGKRQKVKEKRRLYRKAIESIAGYVLI